MHYKCRWLSLAGKPTPAPLYGRMVALRHFKLDQKDHFRIKSINRSPNDRDTRIVVANSLQPGRPAIHRFTFLLLVCWPLYVAAEPSNQGVYRWTDEAGQVHYGTRPPGDDARRILTRRPEALSNDRMSEDARADLRRRMLESYQREREIRQQAEAQRSAQEQREALRCKQLTRHWKKLHHSGPIYYEDAQAGRRFLNEQERQAEKDALQQRLQAACGNVPAW